MQITRRKALVALALTGAIVATGCGGSSSGGGGKKGGTLTIGVLDGPKTFKSTDGELGNRAPYFQAVYDSLTHINLDGSLAPSLAEKWEYSDDLKTLTMTLRKGVKFTDGTPFNADAAAQNLNRYKASDGIGAPLVSLMDKAEAKDDTTLVVTLTAPDPGFLTYLGGPAGMMQSPKTFGSADEATKPVGTGPYVLDAAKSVAGSSYSFTANPDYWDKKSVKYSALVFKVLSDSTANANALKAGEVDAANVITPDKVKELKDAGLTIQTQELDWSGLTFVDRDGSMSSKFADVKVRQAVNYAIDRDAILKGQGQGLGTVTTQVFRESSAGYDKALDSAYPHDPAKAKALLAEAGLADGFEVDMATVPGLGDAVAALLSDQLGAVGIKINWISTEISEYFPAILGPKYPAFFMQLEQNPNDWVALNFLVTKAAIWNPLHLGDAKSDELIAKIQTASDKDRGALYKELNKYIVEQAWYAPFYRAQMNYASNAKKVKVEIQTGNAVPFLWNFSPV